MPAAEATVTIAARCCFLSAGMNALVVQNRLSTFTAKVRRICCSVRSSNGAPETTPALLISTLTRPSASIVSAAARCTAALSVTSTVKAMAFGSDGSAPTCALAMSAVVRAASPLMSQIATRPPSSTIRSAISRPMPEPAPVITTQAPA